MIKERDKDTALRVCDECGHEQWVSYWNVYRKNRHLCRYCNNRQEGQKRKGREPHNKGVKQTPKNVGSGYLNSNGYYEVWVGEHTLPNRSGGYYREHRLMAEIKIGRELVDEEKVHHIDGDKTNNRPSNLYVCSSHANHRHVHSQLERLSMSLVKLGWFKFDQSKGEYYIDPFLREQISKSGELLENPNGKDEGDQQRSLREMSPEERSETIQKWSTLKRVEAPDTLTVYLTEGDDIVPSVLKNTAASLGGQEVATLGEEKET